MTTTAAPQPGDTYLAFNGVNSYVEIPSINSYGVSDAGALTIAVWMRPDTVNFEKIEGTGYVHWIGKGEGSGANGQQEWVFRIYNRDDTTENPPRPNRISFYLFNPDGRTGVGSYVQNEVQEGAWIHLASVADGTRTYLYLNGRYIRCDTYRGPSQGGCPIHFQPPPNQDVQLVIQPQNGSAPLRLGTRDFASYFQGGVSRMRIWSRVLAAAEIAGLYAADTAPQDGLVAEFMLDADTGQVAIDTAQGNNGAIFGATWSVQQ
jgi:hypothetical protein